MSYAFFSVTDKTEIESLAKGFVAQGIQIISTGGTRSYLQNHGIESIAIEEITKKPEAFQGRMKSISFEMASGILFRREDNKDIEEAQRLQIPVIDYVVINFYPFQEQVAQNTEFKDLIDYIDIGGPTLLRAAAKNFSAVTILSHHLQYSHCLEELKREGKTSLQFRRQMAKEAFLLTASYEQSISDMFVKEENGNLRYGENPHQSAIAKVDAKYWHLVQENKEMSYNNYLDAHHAWRAAIDLYDFQSDLCGAVVVKHNNPCGMAQHKDPLKALQLAWQGDPVSAFGGIIALNQNLTLPVAQFLKDKFVEVIIAPSYQQEALEILKSKTQTRLLQLPLKSSSSLQRVSILGGELVQSMDVKIDWTLTWKTQTKDTDRESLLRFAFLAAKHLKSNAIVLAREFMDGYQMVGAGMGQPNRIDCIRRLAIPRMKEYFSEINMGDVVLASDAFFPFADSIEVCQQEGITTIVQPGGSVRDQEVIERANDIGIAMAFTGTRHFKH